MRERHGEVFTGAQRFLDSATYGLPSQRQTQVLHDALDDWSAGTMDASVFDEAVDAARRGFASLVGVSPSAVAIGSAASGLVGLVPASLPDGSRVAVQHGEFTSVTAPSPSSPIAASRCTRSSPANWRIGLTPSTSSR